MDLHQASAFSGVSPLPVVLHTMTTNLAMSLSSTFLTLFKCLQTLAIFNLEHFSWRSLAISSEFPVCDPYRIWTSLPVIVEDNR